MPSLKKKSYILKIFKILSREYIDLKSELNFKNEYQLYVSVLLSAQCTDQRVNKTTIDLFKKFPGFGGLSKASLNELMTIIKSCGLYRGKARNLIAGSKIIVEKFNALLPANRKDLESLPGIGRKSANVILAINFGEATFPVDTHVSRLSGRLGISREISPDKIEADVRNSLPSKYWIDFHHSLIFHGRRVCKARNPNCADCSLDKLCPKKTGPKKL